MCIIAFKYCHSSSCVVSCCIYFVNGGQTGCHHLAAKQVELPIKSAEPDTELLSLSGLELMDCMYSNDCS